MANGDSLLTKYLETVETLEPMCWYGEVVEMAGLIIESRGPSVAVGDFCQIQTSSGRTIRTQVVGFRDGLVLSMPLEEIDGLQLGDRIIARKQQARLGVGQGLLGRVLDGFGRPLDGGPQIPVEALYNLYQTPASPMSRENISERVVTGVRAIDAFLPCGRGQRIGIFGGSGVGKSTLLGAMARNSSTDVSVIALIGERNREVKEFIEKDLGPEGLKRSVVIVSTSDRPAPLRVRASFVALAVAEYFRDQGSNVLLVMDSVTRLAMAQREIGLASGEPPSQKGYTPSVFAMLPRIFERAGNFNSGSITGFFTVLVESDDFNEPICDAVRGILDGHIVLSRDLAVSGHYPAIDVLHSISRLATRVTPPRERQLVSALRESLAVYQRSEDLIQLGAHVQGVNAKLDSSIQNHGSILDFLRQDCAEFAPLDETLKKVEDLARALG